MEGSSDFSPAHLFFPLFVPLFPHSEASECSLGHLAFAHDLIADSCPKLILNLDVTPGEFYFACCQSVSENSLPCLCYGLYSGAENEPAFKEARSYNDSQYAAFSYLVRTEEKETLPQFADASIDLLHIAGLRDYETASHALRSCMPKMRPGAIILISDIVAREEGFGVWRLWDEVTVQFAQTFAFHEGRGLGVMRVPGGNDELSALLRLLFSGSSIEAEFIRRYYTFYTAYLHNRLHPEGERVSQRTHQTVLRELQTAQAERMMTVAELKDVVEQRNAARREIYRIENDLKDVKAHDAQLATDVANWKSMVDYERNIREQILDSLSWKLTKPLRVGIAWVRKLRG